ncbi:NAD(P)H-dependent glycerol-3-phosphate dehydrogenase [Foetidibacter luteolus]|uniref:NAD(P)H-dependent glycerol-3-phosphate dehydrogenase n=1 Tax=Foetidibacter luteolus TaxID=2608880 RepID=UPI00129BE658|nr:NAD(P)H-dependent glycerol-3-phosphate dehydrogenase [Foetidibacter luteolus]
MLNNIAVIGSGSWATALVKIFAESGVHIKWLVRNQHAADYIRQYRHNPRYLSYANLNTKYITPLTSAEEALQDVDFILFAVPSAHLKNTVQDIEPEWLAGKQLAVSIKSFVPGTGNIPGVFLKKYFTAEQPVMVLGGPCHAEEIAMQRNTYLTAAGDDMAMVKQVCDSIKVPYIKTIANADPSGVEYSAILKNIIGIATGIANGLHYGENFQAVLASNAMREVQRFLAAVNHTTRDLFDSAYFGDMLVTAYSDFSRNRTLGKLIGRGMQVTKALQAMEMVAEGYNASKELSVVMKQLNLSLPIMNSVGRILHHHANPFHEFKLIEQQLR